MTSNHSDNKFDDVPDTDDEQTPLLNNNIQQTTANDNTVRVPSISRYRLTNILRILFFIEFLTILIIWFTGMK
jgi:hypothetical protein